MAVKYKMDEDARDQLDRRVLSGREALKTHDSYASEEAETAARDLVSDILTTLFGPAGYCVEGGSPSSPGEVVVGPYKVVLDEERGGLARTFLDMAYESWEGDAEAYTATAVTVDNPPLPSEQKTRRLVIEMTEDELEEQLAVEGLVRTEGNELSILRDYGRIVTE